MTQQLTEKQKGGIAIAVVVAVVIVLLVLMWPKASSATTEEEKPIIEPAIPIVLNPNPYAPKTTPTPGEYYIPVAGDGDIRICQKAGLTPVSKAKVVLRDHPLNDWVAKTSMYGVKQLDLDWGYEHMSGRESQDWAWKTPHVGGGGRAVCIVYVPTQKEVDAA